MNKTLDKKQVNWKIPISLLAKIHKEAKSLGYGTVTQFVIQVFIDYFKNKER